MQQLDHVSVVIVTYNSAAVIQEALRSVIKHPLVVNCFIVDNASTDETCSIVQQHYPEVILIENAKNLGFGCANNIALTRTKTPYALLLNPDAQLQPDTLDKLIVAAKKYPNAAILAPKLINKDGLGHQSFKRNVFTREKYSFPYVEAEGDVCAEFLSGALWLFNMENMRQVGFFDENIFLFYEDDDLCLRVRQANLGLVYVYDSVAIHLMGASTSTDMGEFKQFQLTLSRLYLEQKYMGRAKMLALRLLGGVVFKYCLYALFFNTRKKLRYKARLQAILWFLKQNGVGG